MARLRGQQTAKLLRQFAVYMSRQAPLAERPAHIEHVYKGIKKQWKALSAKERGETMRRIQRELANAA